MAKYQMNQLKEGDMYWTPKFASDTFLFEAGYKMYDFGCWGDIAEGWAFDNEQECAELCKKLNDAIRPFKNVGKEHN